MGQTSEGQNLLITGARVYTADPQQPWAEAIALRGDRILYVGSGAEARERAGAGAEHIHVAGGLALPGLNESHVHMTGASEALDMLDLDGVATLPELQERLREYAAAQPEREWIEGYALGYEA